MKPPIVSLLLLALGLASGLNGSASVRPSRSAMAADVVAVSSRTTAEHQNSHSVSRAAGTNSISESSLSSKPVTVEDLINFATIGNPQSMDWKGQDRLAEDPGLLSPNGRRIVVVVHRGNTDKGTNDAALLVYESAELLRRPRPDTVAEFSSATNYQPIGLVRWLDNDTLVFAATSGEQLSQIYSFNLIKRDLVQLTHESAQLMSYDITPSGERLVTLSERRGQPPAEDAHCRHYGCRVTANDLYSAEHGLIVGSATLSVHNLSQGTTEVFANPEISGHTTLRCDDALHGGISPDGRFALRTCEILEWPQWWENYTLSPLLRECWERRNTGWPNSFCGRNLMVLDLESGESTSYSDAPYIPWGSAVDPLWIDGGRHFILPCAVEPLTVDDYSERALRARSWAVVLVDPITRSTTRIARLDKRTARVSRASWDDKHQTLVVQALDSNHLPLPAVRVRRVGNRWIAETSDLDTSEAKKRSGIRLVIEQSLNERPVLVAVDEKDDSRQLVLDPNPWLASRDLGRVEAITWHSADGRVWQGGLYLPPEYQAGSRYPLVIQTHGFEAERFSMHGVARNFAGRALVAQGIAVLQVADYYPDVGGRPEEWPVVQAGYESAIDHLDKAGVINRTRVGIQGWSATGPYMGYTLTHSAYQFAAGAFTSTTDNGWLYYLATGGLLDLERKYGAAPFDDGLKVWQRFSPSFRLDHVQTPMLMWSNNAVWGLWDWYAGLRRLNKPVEYWFLPDGEHDLFKVGERCLTSHLLVDWFRFWLKGEEDPDPIKADQYMRWREFRKKDVRPVTQNSDVRNQNPG